MLLFDRVKVSTSVITPPKEEKSAKYKSLLKAVTISIAYSANVGGMASLTGSAPNMIMKDYADK
jgi:di/tricarboxylate transporter